MISEHESYIKHHVCVCVCACVLSHAQLFVTPWTEAPQLSQAQLFVAPWTGKIPVHGIFPGKNTGVGCQFPSPGNVPNPGVKSVLALAGSFFATAPPGKFMLRISDCQFSECNNGIWLRKRISSFLGDYTLKYWVINFIQIARGISNLTYTSLFSC